MQQLTSIDERGLEEWVEKNKLETAWKPKHLRRTGLTMGGMGMGVDIKMDYRKTDLFAEHICLYIDTLNVYLTYESKIYLAKEITETSCMFDEVMEHEQNHHKINMAAVRKNAKQIKKDIAHIIGEFEGAGEIYYEDIEKRMGVIKGGIKDFLRLYLNEMSKNAEFYNDSLDSPEEYERISAILSGCREKQRSGKLATRH